MYGIAQVEEISGISAFTIRYYDKCGFFPNLQRDKHGSRVFSDADIEQLKLVDALRKSGLSIEGIQYFVKTSSKDPLNPDCLEVLKDRLKVLEIKKAEIDASAAMIEKAIEVFRQVDGPDASDLMDL
ncbi:MAG: MerR family transcriptional regulator [Eggerthellaceae bacterium]|nr:MerR family transcriptional regulator [Eggerthellaceae bacterium]